MSLTQTINYDDQNNFNFDSDKVEFVGGSARLKIVDAAPANFTQDFSSAVGFTYNAANTEFTGSVVRQKDQRPANATFLAKFTNDQNGTWGDGSLVGTLGGPATYDAINDRVDVIGVNAYYEINPTSKFNADARIFTIRFKFIPNYTGNPASLVTFYEHSELVGNQSRFILYHDTASAIRMTVYNAAGGVIIAGAAFGTLVVTSGTEYVMEMNVDLVTGANRLFVNGTQQGLTNVNVGTHGPVEICRFGSNAGTGSMTIDDVVIFNTVQHTSNHAGSLPWVYSEYVYNADTISLPTFSYALLGTLQELTAGAIVDTNAPKYIINNGVNDYWFNGALWVVSNGTIGESNFGTTLINNLGSFLPPTLTNSLTVKILTSNTITVANQQSTDNLQLTYVGQTYDITNSSILWASEILMDGLDQFLETAVKPALTEVKYVLTFSNVDYWYNGANWAVSNGSYAQANTAAEIETNKATFSALIGSGGRIKLKAYLHTDDGQATPQLATVQVDYNFYVEPPAENPQCIVYMFAEDLLNTIDFNAQNAIFYVKNSGFINEGDRLILPFQFQTNFTSFGYAELPVAQTELSQKKIQFWVEYDNLQGTHKKVQFPSIVIPAQVSANLADLI